MGTLRITRARQVMNVMRKLQILVDSKSVAAVAHGASVELSLPAGRHEVMAKLDWCRSPPVSVSIEEARPVELEVGCNAPPWPGFAALWMVLFRPREYLYLRPPRP